MDESKSGRALNSVEKAEADALTNKQWLYLICKSVQDDEEITGNTLKHETTDHDTVDARGRIGRILHWTERALGIAASISTVVALVFAAWQIYIGNWQFDRSGPRFSWFDTGLVSYTTEATLPDGLSGTGEVQAIVVSNTGRTGDTIVGMGRAGDGDAMVLCTPEFDEDGNLMDRDAVSVGGGTVALQPGDSRLVFAVSVHGPIPVTGGLEVATTSGRTYHAERVRYVSRLSVDHYARLPGWFDAQDACVRRLGRLG